MKPERLSAAQVRPLGLNKPFPFEYSLCVKVKGHGHIKTFNVVKEGDVIRHLNNSSKEPLNKSPSFSAERENRRLPLGSSDSVGK